MSMFRPLDCLAALMIAVLDIAKHRHELANYKDKIVDDLIANVQEEDIEFTLYLFELICKEIKERSNNGHSQKM